MSKSHSTRRARLFRAGIATGAAVVTALAVTASPAFAEAKLALSASSGPTAGGNTVTAQAPTTAAAPFLASTAPTVQFQAITSTVTTCSALYKTPATVAGASNVLTAGAVDAVTVTRINSYRIAVKIPAGVVLPANFTVAKYNMCVYDAASTSASTLLASAAYSVAAKPVITNITPTSGPALGGYQINVSGTGLTSGSTATLGNVPLSNVTVNTSGTLLTGTAPARTAGSGIQLVINSLGGTVSSADPNGDATLTDATNFTLTNGIIVTPNTAPSNTTPSLDIMGVGFSALTFADVDQTTSASTTAHVALVPKSTGYVKNTDRMIAVCEDVLVLSDTELLCTLDLTGSLDTTQEDATFGATDVPDGAYNIQIIQDGADDAATPAPTAITSGSTFTVAAY